MSSTNKKSPGARAVPQPFHRQLGHAPQSKPVVAQLKTAVSAQSVRRPVAPPVYRPQAMQNAMQPKMANGALNGKSPVAPPVYRPQQLSKVLQTKSSSAQSPQAGQTSRQPVASLRSTIQPKTLMSGRGAGVIQRNCGTPGCNDPNCHDPSNHGHDRVYGLRGRTLYSGNITNADIGTGTGTNQGTRDYVNSATTPYPQEIRIEYSSAANGGYSSFPNQPLAPNQRADAGHIFGAQYGGFGNQNASVFPQHPQTNRGNSYLGNPTFDLWRGQENAIRNEAQSGNPTNVAVVLHNTPSARLRICPTCNRQTFTSAATCPECGAPLP